MRWDIINHYIEKNGYKSYLEIGIDKGKCWTQIETENKTGVDPAKTQFPEVIQKTSDEFFELNKYSFDIIFIDGLHHKDQVLKDIDNSLRCLNPDGMILCHDILPDNEIMQRVPRETVAWTGDCWKAFAELKATRSDLSMFVYNIDYGVGVIKRGKQGLIERAEWDWNWFVKNKSKLNIKKWSLSTPA